MARKSLGRRGSGGQLGKSPKGPKKRAPSTPTPQPGRFSGIGTKATEAARSLGGVVGGGLSSIGEKAVDAGVVAGQKAAPYMREAAQSAVTMDSTYDQFDAQVGGNREGSFVLGKEIAPVPVTNRKVEGCGVSISQQEGNYKDLEQMDFEEYKEHSRQRNNFFVDEARGVGMLVSDQSSELETVRDPASHGNSQLAETFARGVHESLSFQKKVGSQEMSEAIQAGYGTFEEELRLRSADGNVEPVATAEIYGFDAVAFQGENALISHLGAGMVYRFRGGVVEEMITDPQPGMFNRERNNGAIEQVFDVEDEDSVIIVSPPIRTILTPDDIAKIVKKAKGEPDMTDEEISRRIANSAYLRNKQNVQASLTEPDLSVVTLKKPQPQPETEPAEVPVVTPVVETAPVVDKDWEAGRNKRRQSSEAHQVVAQSISRERQAHLLEQQAYWYAKAGIGNEVSKVSSVDLQTISDVLTAYDLFYAEKWVEDPERAANLHEVVRRYLAGEIPGSPQEQASTYVLLSIIENEISDPDSEFAGNYSSLGKGELDDQGEQTLDAVMRARDALFTNLTGVKIDREDIDHAKLKEEREKLVWYKRVFRGEVDRKKLERSRTKRDEQYKKHAKDFRVEGWLADANQSLQEGSAFQATRGEVYGESQHIVKGMVEKIQDVPTKQDVEAFVTQLQREFAPPADIEQKLEEVQTSLSNAQYGEIKIKVLQVEYLAAKCQRAENLTALHEVVNASGNKELMQVLTELDISPEEKVLEDLVMPKLDEAAKKIVIREELPTDVRVVEGLLGQIDLEISSLDKTDPDYATKVDDLRLRKAVMEDVVKAVNSDVLIQAAKVSEPDLDIAKGLFPGWGRSSMEDDLYTYYGVDKNLPDAKDQLKEKMGSGFSFARVLAGLLGLSLKKENKARQPKPKSGNRTRGRRQSNP
ncbi:hypothetical protein GW793_04105 [bacterium]|uniref:Uncharacterized protein n=2 Tax=Katanobacteria TaxID=422282 RepID=A0A2M7X244_UNCKA|nr:hypothetical protein [bacterium]PIP56335.1 MAG: hypothetical protein COX05_03645 [candidate division WWE3 bacterium CG22_combo_CG10-13_8_21_14_all_39_12]PJA40207.1 MAG: hypothetical protein CO179_03035 [candidate division WWE3 bacterium CG_4_9_14_3_um_filter_39_7]